jgi:hypothetical protein
MYTTVEHVHVTVESRDYALPFCMLYTVFPRLDAAATNFLPLLKLVAIIQGRRILKGSDKNIHNNITAYKNNEKVCCKFNT